MTRVRILQQILIILSVFFLGLFALEALFDYGTSLLFWKLFRFDIYYFHAPLETVVPTFTLGFLTLLGLGISLALKRYKLTLVLIGVFIFQVWYVFLLGHPEFPVWTESQSLWWDNLFKVNASCTPSPAVYSVERRIIKAAVTCGAGNINKVYPISGDQEALWCFLFGAVFFGGSRYIETGNVKKALADMLTLSSMILATFTAGVYFILPDYWNVHVTEFAHNLLGMNLYFVTNSMLFQISAAVIALRAFYLMTSTRYA